MVPDTLETLAMSMCEQTKRLLVDLDDISPDKHLDVTESGVYPRTLGSKSFNLGHMSGIFDIPKGLALRTTCFDLHVELLGA